MRTRSHSRSHTHTHTHTLTHTHTHTLTHSHKHTHAHARTHTNARTHARTHTTISTHARTHARTHTQTHSPKHLKHHETYNLRASRCEAGGKHHQCSGGSLLEIDPTASVIGCLGSCACEFLFALLSITRRPITRSRRLPLSRRRN